MGNKVSRDETPKIEAEPEPYKNILLFVLIGNNMLYEIKRKRIQSTHHKFPFIQLPIHTFKLFLNLKQHLK